MHTVKILLAGLILLAACLAGGRLAGNLSAGGLAFIPLWLIASGVNMWMGVSHAGYSAREELPIFLLVFCLPAALALLLWWTLS
ncbi:hypothetical protein [Chromobacterium sp. IIBBL 290-4]|uniref:hypothetical protein n=1 Tax=Chromobacterium sp. IIBBL 290-4 TaxID=2953890 RepID=UPI0020B80796|nr:hypothetical protein [Chromobacterium sp. IIBBL 290-4]UTH72802.1 hypothetical protein NKT35_14790 [Chromobacterium sp. IIBBL 290-4]